jgi:hypothetical protein
MATADDHQSAGSDRPSIVGEVSKVADTKLMTLLLGRSAKAVGD